jgi:uncharacterized protein
MRLRVVARGHRPSPASRAPYARGPKEKTAMTDIHAQVRQFTKMLKSLDRQLGKASEQATAKKYDPGVLLQARLAPDMFPLVKQVQRACDGVKFLAARTSGRDAPKHPDTEQTMDELRARVQTVIEYAEGFGPDVFASAESRVVPMNFMPGKGMAAFDWVREFNVPNTYFHFAMAYAILRLNAVDLGKADWIGSLTLRDL